MNTQVSQAPLFARVHYPTYLYDGAVASAFLAALLLISGSFVEKKGLLYGLTGFFTVLAVMLGLTYYYLTREKGMGYSVSLLDTVDGDSSKVCLHGYAPEDCEKCTDSRGKSGCACGF